MINLCDDDDGNDVNVMIVTVIPSPFCDNDIVDDVDDVDVFIVSAMSLFLPTR